MNDLVVTLIPLIVGSAIVPLHIVITILLVRGPGGRSVAVAWIAGMTAFRLLQGLVFGLVLDAGQATPDGDDPASIVSALLLVLAIVFYVVAARQLLRAPDEDAAPPRWMAMLEGVTPARAFALGFGLLAIGAKFWVFTLGAIAAIGEAELGQAAAIVAFVLFVVLAQGVHLGVVGFDLVAPSRADAALGRFSAALTRYNRPIVVGLGLAFGTWFLVEALRSFGILQA